MPKKNKLQEVISSSSFSGKAISRAGEQLLDDKLKSKDPESFENAMNIVGYWRSSHEEPLERAYNLLREVTAKIEHRAVVAKRLKRTVSILSKLRRFEGMKLRTMQDIGGCRAILASEKNIMKAVREINKKRNFKVKNYLTQPKDDGYRGIHLMGNFAKQGGERRAIEIQLRTKTQHSWATAVEIIDLFTGQSLKSSQGKDEWLLFFKAASDVFIELEKLSNLTRSPARDLVNRIATILFNERDTKGPYVIAKKFEKLYITASAVNVREKLIAYSVAVKAAEEELLKDAKNRYVLLEINLEEPSIKPSIYNDNDFERAANDYIEAEKSTVSNAQKVVALVSTDAVGGLREAFPNYFADSTKFLELIEICIQSYKLYNPSILSRFTKKL